MLEDEDFSFEKFVSNSIETGHEILNIEISTTFNIETILNIESKNSKFSDENLSSSFRLLRSNTFHRSACSLSDRRD